MTGPELEAKPPPSNAPLVRIKTAEAELVQLTSFTHGTVLPRTESELVPEVSGRIVEISPTMVSGGFFNKGDTLVKIDPLNYEVALEQALANQSSAESELDNAKRASARVQDLATRQSASQSERDDAVNRVSIAEATLRDATARVARAERDLERTEIHAPYDGRVRSERIDIGQFVDRGASIASLYATDIAEVRLPIHDDELRFLQLPLAQSENPVQPAVVLRARFGGEMHSWEGKVVRTEGELDPKTRMINVIAQVASPYALVENRPPLAVGLFVEAEIIGKQVENVVILPRDALQQDDRVYVIDADNRLEFRDVTVLRMLDDEVYIASGIERGERVCLSSLDVAIEGMSVQPVNDVEGYASS
ncbi:MAG: efflux RND transporter periplasmic adaptor subunit [Pseudomonadota bacterium]